LITFVANLRGRLFRETQAGAFASFADRVQLDGLRAAAVAGWAIAAGDSPMPPQSGQAMYSVRRTKPTPLQIGQHRMVMLAVYNGRVSCDTTLRETTAWKDDLEQRARIGRER
jgi:hypothetical protein